MKKSIIILLIIFTHLNVFSQEYVWTVYNVKVDRVNAGQVVTAMDKYLSKPGNLVDGVTVSLFEIMFASNDMDATHVIAFTGSADAMNAQYSRETGDDWKVMMSTFDQVTKSDGSAAGRSIHTINTDAEGPMQHIIQMKVDEPQKYAPAFKKMWSTVKPSGRLTLGQFISGRKDGVSHYILISRNNLKDLLSPRDWNTKEQDAWEKYREERGDSEIITTMTRALVKQWK